MKCFQYYGKLFCVNHIDEECQEIVSIDFPEDFAGK